MDIIWIIFFLLSLGVHQILKNKFATYTNTSLQAALSGAEIAAKMLQQYNIQGVQITCTNGYLSDHYNPLNKTVNLSKDVYYGKNAAAAAVAAHECGHAVQHAQGYAFLKFRSAMTPVISFSARYMGWLILLGIFVINTTPIPLQIGIGLFALTTLFTFVTLPVEFDASQRALVWMHNCGVVTSQEYSMAKDALRWAALTYVIAALGSLAQLLQLLFYTSRRRD